MTPPEANEHSPSSPATKPPGTSRRATVPGEARPGGLLVRPRLAGPAAAARDRFRALREVAAALRWIAAAWLRPAGSEARWEQRAGREPVGGPGAAAERAGGRHHPQGQTRTTGTSQ